MSYGQGYGRSQTFARPQSTATAATPASLDDYAVPATLPPNVDLSAPVIHFGTTNPMPRERIRQGPVDFVPSQTLLAPPTRQQKMHSLWIGGCPADILDDYWMERILKAAGKLKGWRRATDALGQGRAFGFAEYDDPEHVKRAYTILQDLAIKLPPVYEGKTLQLTATIDEGGSMYINDFLQAREIKDPELKDAASLKQHRAQVAQVLRDLASPKFKKPEKYLKDKTSSKGSQPEQAPAASTAAPLNDPNAVTIMLSVEDELSDLPEDQRRYIADEITGFRTRSAQRDADRQRKVADVELRRAEFERAARGTQTLAQQKEARRTKRTEDAEDASLVLKPKRNMHTEAERNMTDAEIEASRKAAADLARQPRYVEAEWRLLSRERQRLEHLQQAALRAQGDSRRKEEDRIHAARKYAAYDDAKEDARGLDTYFSDFGSWKRTRMAFRQREMQADAEDRLAEERELAKQQEPPKQVEAIKPQEAKTAESAPVRLTIAKTTERKVAPTGTVLRATGDDEDEEEAQARKRKLVPLRFDEEEDRHARLKRIVDAIPIEKDALWKYDVPWQHLSQDGLLDKFRIFVAKKCVEAIGVEADELIEFVLEHVSNHGSAADLEVEMVNAIGDEDEAAAFTVKCWRYLLILLETSSM